MINFETIRRLADEFPGMREGTSYGTPAMKVGKKLVLREHQDEDAIVLMLASLEDQQGLIVQDPGTFYLTDHYRGYPAVLVRTTIGETTMRELMGAAWRRLAGRREIAEYEKGRVQE